MKITLPLFLILPLFFGNQANTQPLASRARRAVNTLIKTPEREARAAKLFAARGTPVFEGTAWELLSAEERMPLAIAEAFEAEIDAEIETLEVQWLMLLPSKKPTSIQAQSIEQVLRVIFGDEQSALRDQLSARLAQLAAGTDSLERREEANVFLDTLNLRPGNIDRRTDDLGEVFGHTVRRLIDARKAGDQALAQKRRIEAVRIVIEAYLIAGANLGNFEKNTELASAFATFYSLPALASGFALTGVAAESGSLMAGSGAVASLAFFSTALYVSFANVGRKFNGKRPLWLPRFAQRRGQRQLATHIQNRFWRTAEITMIGANEWEDLKSPDELQWHARYRLDHVQSLINHFVKLIQAPISCRALLQ